MNFVVVFVVVEKRTEKIIYLWNNNNCVAWMKYNFEKESDNT